MAPYFSREIVIWGGWINEDVAHCDTKNVILFVLFGNGDF